MKTLKIILWIAPTFFIIQLVAGMYIVIWNNTLISQLYAKVFFTSGITSFFCIAILSLIDKKSSKN